jgi:prophage tail gpP-like protein
MKLKINDNFYSFFDDVTINKNLDSIASTFSLKGRFNPDNDFHKKIFKPLNYNKVEIFDDFDKLMLTGVAVNTSLKSVGSRELQVVSGYSKAGVLEDCTIPYSSYPLEKNNVSLTDVVSRLITEFGISFAVDSSVSNEMNLRYKKTVAEASESIKSFISKLAAQRNVILSHTADGNLLFYRPNTKASPRYYFTKENTISMSLDIDGQSMFSEISVIRQPSDENTNLSPFDTVKNDLVKAKRTLVKVLSSGNETDTKRAVENIIAAQMKSIKFTVDLKSYIDLDCGDIVEVENDEIYLYQGTRLMVSSIAIKENSNSKSMSINLVLPESFSGQVPKNIFDEF